LTRNMDTKKIEQMSQVINIKEFYRTGYRHLENLAIFNPKMRLNHRILKEKKIEF
jgi:hypothetical protein